MQSQVATRVFLRGGYTYNDGVVQRSFRQVQQGQARIRCFHRSRSVQALRWSGRGPFRQPPHVGFMQMNYSGSKLSVSVQGSFAHRSDDSTFLAGSDFNLGNTLLLPNRNLDAAYAKVDVGGSYQAFKDLALYAQLNNLVSDQHIGPIGYPSLPFTFRMGVRLQIGHQK